MYISYFDYFTSLTCYVQTVLVSCFIYDGLCVYVRSTFHYRTVSELQNSSQTLRFVFFFWQLLASFVYSARILEGFHLIHLDLSPTYLAYHTLRDRKKWFTYTDISVRNNIIYGYDKLPCIINVYCFISRTHHLDLLSKLLASYSATCFSGTVGTRTSRRDGAHKRYKRSLFPSTSWQHQFLLNMLII